MGGPLATATSLAAAEGRWPPTTATRPKGLATGLGTRSPPGSQASLPFVQLKGTLGPCAGAPAADKAGTHLGKMLPCIQMAVTSKCLLPASQSARETFSAAGEAQHPLAMREKG